MITLIYGGSGSGKSAFAEDYICKTDYRYKYYLATMNACDNESKERVNRHRKLRQGKGFITLEHPTDILAAVDEICEIDEGDFSTGKKDSQVVLLECMSNLVANEMFKDGKINSAKHCVDKIIHELEVLSKEVDSVVVVSNNIFEDGIDFDEDTREYLRALGTINAKLGRMAEEVYEVVVGIGLKVKG